MNKLNNYMKSGDYSKDKITQNYNQYFLNVIILTSHKYAKKHVGTSSDKFIFIIGDTK